MRISYSQRHPIMNHIWTRIARICGSHPRMQQQQQQQPQQLQPQQQSQQAQEQRLVLGMEFDSRAAAAKTETDRRWHFLIVEAISEYLGMFTVSLFSLSLFLSLSLSPSLVARALSRHTPAHIH